MDVVLFENGQYQSLLENLQKVKQDVHVSSQYGSMAKQLSLVNNQAVCRYLLGKTEEKRKCCSLDFVDVLKKCRSVPAKEEMLCVELCSLYNYIYCISEISCNPDRHAEITDIYNQAYRTFSRVCRMLSQEKRMENVLQHNDIKTASYAMLNNILEKLHYGIGNESLSMCVCQCGLALAVHEIRNGDYSTVYKLLEEVKIVLGNIETGNNKQSALCLPLRVEHSQLYLMNKAHIEDTVSLLIGICLCRSHALEEAVGTLEAISTQQIRCVSQFYCGFILFKSDKYTESISSLLEMLRSGQSLTQRLKARIYNLIARCFDKLNKCQLSVQMYKEALSADFSYLVPLFNTSLQYRNQGVKDMELECLNLLVAALGMREKPERCYDSMDLACLLDTEDEDIPYIKAIYTLSLRSLQLKRYDVAAEQYVSLLDYLKLWKADRKIMTSIPPLLQIHHEAIEALLMSKNYKDCVSLCDRVLLCYHNNMSSLNESSVLSQTFDLTPSQGLVADSQTGRDKRKFDEFSQGEEDEHFGDIDVVTLKYKALALFKMGDNSRSLVCLERAIDSITNYRKLCLRQKMKDVASSTEPTEPSQKRQKLNHLSSASTRNNSMECDVELASTSEKTCVSNICDKGSVIGELLGDSSRMLGLEQDLYELTADILESMEKPKDAVHFRRLATQIKLTKKEAVER